ncbi:MULTISPECIES: hypothetical protein [unclassified Streptomyces]|uniref:hypothetical protein n=1 Tax=unclassified Streptomyces TaxID=2593676 RepID=UPI000938ACA0|nr:hypothetical protein [Streptomyces sp. CB02058]OKI93668.1 hypothetical protein AMK10_14750 [Streptomyces sp. CB02058]
MSTGAGQAPEERSWLIAANVVRWRRYGEGGQELRPGTKSYRGGSKVHVLQSYAGSAHEQLTTIGRGRHTGTYITIDMATRNLHTFRAVAVHSPTVLRLCEEADVGGCWTTREDAEELAVRLERLAAEYRTAHWSSAHPVPCRCHECLTLSRV